MHVGITDTLLLLSQTNANLEYTSRTSLRLKLKLLICFKLQKNLSKNGFLNVYINIGQVAVCKDIFRISYSNRQRDFWLTIWIKLHYVLNFSFCSVEAGLFKSKKVST